MKVELYYLAMFESVLTIHNTCMFNDKSRYITIVCKDEWSCVAFVI